MTPNTEWRKAGAALCAGAVFFAVCISALLAIDGMGGGYAIAFVSFFLMVCSIMVAFLYFHRARVMDAILRDPAPFAHWTYPETMAQETVEREYGDFQERNRATFLVVGGMLIIAAFVLFLFVEDGGIETGILMLIIATLLFIVSKAAPWLERNRAKKAPAEAYIAHAGVIWLGSVYPFRSFSVSPPQVAFRPAGRNRPATVTFAFTQMAGLYIVQPFDVAVPVPAGREEEARRVVRELGGALPE